MAAEAGNGDAMLNLGRLSLRLNPPDVDGARDWFIKAAEAGNTDAMHDLRLSFEDGSRHWFTEAAAAGNTHAMFQLGMLSDALDGALHWYAKAAEGGNIDAMLQLGKLLSEQLDPPDVDGARDWFIKAADAGNTDAMYSLGYLLWERLGPPDLDGARDWFIKAADAGNTHAMYSLGYLLWEELDPPDLDGAQHWYAKAADAGNTDAMLELGLLCEELDPPDLDAARHWYTTAGEAGESDGWVNLGLLTERLDPPELHGADVHGRGVTPDAWLRDSASAGPGATGERDHRILAAMPAYGVAVAAALSPDAGEALVFPGARNIYRVAAAKGSIQAATMTPDYRLQSIWYSPDGRFVAAVGLFGYGWWVRGDLRPSLRTCSALNEISAARFSADGQLIALGRFEVVVARTGEEADVVASFSLPIPSGGVGTFKDLAFSSDGTRVLGVTLKYLTICDLATYEAERRRLDALDRARACVLSEDGSTLAVGTADGRVVVADVTMGQTFVNRTVSTHIVWDVAIDNMATIVAYSDTALETITVRELDRWSVVTQVPIIGSVDALSFSADGSGLLVAEKVGGAPGEGPHVLLRLLDTRL